MSLTFAGARGFGVGIAFGIVDVVLVAGLCGLSARSWRKARYKVFLSKRETSDHEVG